MFTYRKHTQSDGYAVYEQYERVKGLTAGAVTISTAELAIIVGGTIALYGLYRGAR